MQTILDITNHLNSGNDDLHPIIKSGLLNKELTDLLLDPKDGDFIALDGKIAHLIYQTDGGECGVWESKPIGQPNVLIGINEVIILSELESQYSAINWVVVEGEVTAVTTPFQLHFWDRITIIIDTAYANLE